MEVIKDVWYAAVDGRNLVQSVHKSKDEAEAKVMSADMDYGSKVERVQIVITRIVGR